MRIDLYTKIVLTVIALALVVIALKQAAPPVVAQQAPTAVVITGVDLGRDRHPYLPVMVMGQPQDQVGLDVSRTLRPVQISLADVQTPRPVPITAGQPIPIMSERPLQVDVVRAPAQARPGQ